MNSPRTSSLKDKVVLVTGGSRGIGAAVVRRAAAAGARIYFTYRTGAAEAAKLAGFLGLPEGRAIRCDVRKPEDVEAVLEAVLSAETTLDVLVNNAGVIRDGLFLAMADEDWDEVLDTNLGGTVRFCKAAIRPMMAGGGCIINVSSIVGELGGVGQANYAASKGAVNAFTKALAAELAGKGITVNAVAPGMVKTEMSGAARAAFGDRIRERIPLGEFADPDDVASVIEFLATDAARYITGQILTVDGGLSLLGRK